MNKKIAEVEINNTNFQAILKRLGYYEGKKFDSHQEIRDYLNEENKTSGPLEDPLIFDAELERLADLAIEYNEHTSLKTTPEQLVKINSNCLQISNALTWLITSLLKEREECKGGGVEWCRMENALAIAMRECNIGYVCEQCDYPMRMKPRDNLCQRCFEDYRQ